MSNLESNAALIEEICEWWVYRGLYDHNGDIEKGLTHAGFAGKLTNPLSARDRALLLARIYKATKECAQFDREELGAAAHTPKLIIPPEWVDYEVLADCVGLTPR